ncbi:hypothetical protein MT325_m744L [Paramecium bursaria chlorella virus MT325]|uniref:Uncharacterized protein m744L n=1 Tax=Paramecium bursaria Chlorella virus MT325 TaxID=346932 RepID=A7IVC4_PBCVM|nr:hypothetical protein MT325_m744L [Paramecium bursaria chlorella virus MT325]
MNAFWYLAAIRDCSDQMGNEWFDVLVADGRATLDESSLCSYLHRRAEVYHALGQHRNNFGEEVGNLFRDILRNLGEQSQGILLHLPLIGLINR